MRGAFAKAKRIFLAAVLVASLAPSIAWAETIAVCDVQGALMQTEDGIRAQATLKKLFDKRQQELDAKQTELKRVQVDIEKQTRILSREAIARRVDNWQREMVQLQTVFLDYQ